MNPNNLHYSLGASKEEQLRLIEQQQLYGDAKFLQFAESDIVCEVGCGAGANLWIAEKLKSGKYIGIDVQEKQIAACKKKAAALHLLNTDFFCNSGENIPLPSHSVDAAFCRLVLIHTANPEAVLKEMYRITKPGGKIIAIEPEVKNYQTTKPALLKTFKARVNYIYRPNHGSIDIATQLESYFQQLKLHNIKITKHEIFADGEHNPEKLKKLLKNLLQLLDPVAEMLITKNIITADEYAQAQKEITEINETDSVYQPLWIAEGKK